MPEIELSGGNETIITHCLQVRFLWISDHWKHELVSAGGCHSIPRIWSVEGVPHHEDPGKPCGPLYQRLEARIEPSGVARASLSGQSGSHHFSTTFEVREQPDEVIIDVDVVDRCPDPVKDLSVTYLIEASDGRLRADEVITITWSHPECKLVFEAEPPATATASEAGLGTIRLQAHAELDPSKQAHHFRYRWRWITLPARQIWDREA